MRQLKFTVLVIFFIAFLGGKTHATVSHHHIKKNAVLSCAQLDQKVSDESEDDDFMASRKHRYRGVAVDFPHVTEILFHRTFTYKIYIPSWTTNIYPSFLFCVDRKRGPPFN